MPSLNSPSVGWSSLDGTCAGGCVQPSLLTAHALSFIPVPTAAVIARNAAPVTANIPMDVA